MQMAGAVCIVLTGILGFSGAGVLSFICLVIAGLFFWAGSAERD
jgi:hypothetical protein